ncbi:RNA polymerase sigma factor [Paenibacillus sp. GCM10012306]|uniref:RNA polymerase sigma factor n=1 Tax=Paenibacillus sp. GCM10012306 TaxID=3317342 RepID=UPI00360BD245
MNYFFSYTAREEDANVNEDINEVINKVKLGDTESYATIIRCFQRKIYLYCYYLLSSKEEAEDATQDIFIKGYNNLRNFTPTVSFSSWLYKIAYHHCMDLLKKRNKFLDLIFNYKKEKQQPIADQSSRYTDYVHDLLERLSLEERKILLLRALEEYSFEEIALIMDLKPAGVRKKYERLRKKLLAQKGGIQSEQVYRHG